MNFYARLAQAARAKYAQTLPTVAPRIAPVALRGAVQPAPAGWRQSGPMVQTGAVPAVQRRAAPAPVQPYDQNPAVRGNFPYDPDLANFMLKGASLRKQSDYADVIEGLYNKYRPAADAPFIAKLLGANAGAHIGSRVGHHAGGVGGSLLGALAVENSDKALNVANALGEAPVPPNIRNAIGHLVEIDGRRGGKLYPESVRAQYGGAMGGLAGRFLGRLVGAPLGGVAGYMGTGAAYREAQRAVRRHQIRKFAPKAALGAAGVGLAGLIAHKLLSEKKQEKTADYADVIEGVLNKVKPVETHWAPKALGALGGALVGQQAGWSAADNWGYPLINAAYRNKLLPKAFAQRLVDGATGISAALGSNAGGYAGWHGVHQANTAIQRAARRRMIRQRAPALAGKAALGTAGVGLAGLIAHKLLSEKKQKKEASLVKEALSPELRGRAVGERYVRELAREEARRSGVTDLPRRPNDVARSRVMGNAIRSVDEPAYTDAVRRVALNRGSDAAYGAEELMKRQKVQRAVDHLGTAYRNTRDRNYDLEQRLRTAHRGFKYLKYLGGAGALAGAAGLATNLLPRSSGANGVPGSVAALGLGALGLGTGAYMLGRRHQKDDE